MSIHMLDLPSSSPGLLSRYSQESSSYLSGPVAEVMIRVLPAGNVTDTVTGTEFCTRYGQTYVPTVRTYVYVHGCN